MQKYDNVKKLNFVTVLVRTPLYIIALFIIVGFYEVLIPELFGFRIGVTPRSIIMFASYWYLHKKILSNIYISSFSALIKNISFRPRIKKIFYNSTKDTDITEQIKKLSELKEIGALTDDEFDAKKKELLDRI